MTATKRVGVVEIGSRAIRLLVADVLADEGIRVASSDWRETHLTAAVKLGGSALRAKIKEIKGIVNAFLERCRHLGASRVGVFGMEAIRRMSKEYVQYLSRDMPQLVILDRKSEALCSLIAAVKGLPAAVFQEHDVLMIDQGSGSMELALGHTLDSSVHLISYKSYRLGTQTLVELFRKYKGKIPEFHSKIEKRISQYKLIETGTSMRTIALGSAATKIAWIKVRQNSAEQYSPRRVHGQIIGVSTIDNLIKAATDDPATVRRIINPHNSDGEEFEIVVTGLVALSIFLRKLGKTEFVVSGWGTRHGIAWMLACHEPGVR